jgi:UDP-N-acetylglucosamine 3-dehydrogenase
MNRPSVGVIGVGYWGKKHVEEYVALGADVTAVDLNEDNIKFCAEKYGVKTAKDYSDILLNEEIKTISICTPNETHYKIAKDCLNAGKNILVEKPLAMRIEQGRELIDFAKDNGSTLAVGHIFRFNNAINKVKEMIENYELGEIRIVKLKWANVEPLFEDRDVIFDLAPHPFDIINHLFKRNPDEVSCSGNAYRRSKSKGVEAVFINCMLGEIVINIELSWLTPPKTRSLVVVGSNKSVLVNCTAQTIEVVEDDKSYDLEIIPNNTIRTELQSFLSCIDDKSKKNVSDGEVGLDIVKMIEICQKSLNEKRVLKFGWR